MPRAVIIDDFYARPSGDELRAHIVGIRQVITDDATGALKDWFDAEFGLSGSHMVAAYFDPLLTDAARLQRFWKMRGDSPVGDALPTAFQALVDLLAPAQDCLAAIEGALRSSGWTFDTFAALPVDVAALSLNDLHFIAIDYILKPGDPAPGLQATREFMRGAIETISGNPKYNCPYVFLISENHAAKSDAKGLREFVQIPGAYFRFEEKSKVTAEMVSRLLADFLTQQSQLEKFRRLQLGLKRAIEDGSKALSETFRDLELQDLATLQAGQLVQEGEPFGDYIAWLAGQFLSARMLRDEQLARASSDLEGSGFSVMLGHLQPTQGIPKVFSQVAVYEPQSTLQSAAATRKLPIRFGDLFVKMTSAEKKPKVRRSLAAASRTPGKRWISKRRLPAIPTTSYFLVISQTCDLHHCNITNGQVLCLEGSSRQVLPSEADLLRATFKQMDERIAAIMIPNESGFSEITWTKKDLRSIDQTLLAAQDGYRYVGRVNEIYAMQAQNSALQELGRVGVPIQPAYSMFYGGVSLRVYSGANEEKALATTFDNGMITAVVINEKSADRESPKSQHRITFSEDLRAWLFSVCSKLEVEPSLTNPQFKTSIGRLRSKLEKAVPWSLIVKVDRNGIAAFHEIDNTGKAENKPVPSVQFLLGGPFQPSAANGPRLVIEFMPVSQESK